MIGSAIQTFSGTKISDLERPSTAYSLPTRAISVVSKLHLQAVTRSSAATEIAPVASIQSIIGALKYVIV